MNRTLIKTVSFLSGMLCFSTCTATSPVYLAVSAGVFSGQFANNFTDQTDAIPQSITENTVQSGYIAGLAIGYRRLIHTRYLLGAELAGNYSSHDALYQSGAATSAFSDTVQISHYFDLTFVPGILLSDSVSAYLKLGLSVARLHDSVSSPAGFVPATTNYNSARSVSGFAGAIGIKKQLTDRLSVFTEADYHDYGRVNFADFQNFTATYGHYVRVHSAAVQLGMTCEL